MIKWEYRVYPIKATGTTTLQIGQEINQMGFDGWELVTVQSVNSGKGELLLHYFKREKVVRGPIDA